MRSAITAVLASLVLLAVPATGAVAAPGGAPPSPGAPGIGDPYFPLDGNGGYDVAHYALQVGYQPGADVLTGHAVITARRRPRRSPASTSTSSGCTSTPCASTAGPRRGAVRTTSSGSPRRRPSRRAIGSPSGCATTASRRSSRKRRRSPAASSRPPTERWLIGEPHVAASWFPVNDHPQQQGDVRRQTSPCPRGLQAVSNGALVGTRTHGGVSTTYTSGARPRRWRRYLATATTGHFAITSYRRDGIAFYDADRLPRSCASRAAHRFEVRRLRWRRLELQAADPGSLCLRPAGSSPSTSYATTSPTGTSSPSRPIVLGPPAGPRCPTSTGTRRRAPATAAPTG